MKCFDGNLLPAWERWSEFQSVGFENANGEGANSVVGINTTSILVVDCDFVFTLLKFSSRCCPGKAFCHLV